MWELIFMLVILKIPIVYLCVVVWWAIKAEPRPEEGAPRIAVVEPTPSCGWGGGRSSRRLTRPPRGPSRWAPRPVLVARTEARR